MAWVLANGVAFAPPALHNYNIFNHEYMPRGGTEKRKSPMQKG